MPRILYTPSDYSPTYDVESDGAGNFVKLHAVWDIPPEYPEAKQIMEPHHVEYIMSNTFPAKGGTNSLITSVGLAALLSPPHFYD